MIRVIRRRSQCLRVLPTPPALVQASAYRFRALRASTGTFSSSARLRDAHSQRAPSIPPETRDHTIANYDAQQPQTVLRPYQQSAITACLNALDGGLTRIGVSSPTGSGKTTMFMSLIPLVPDLPEQAARGQVLIIVSSVELALQAEKAAKRILGEGWTVEVEQGKRHSSGRADVTVATYQTLNKTDRLLKFDPGRCRLVIVDEAHHAAAISYLRLLHYFNEGVQLPEHLSPIMKEHHGHKVPIIGFSATFSRPDQLALSAAFEKIVFHREITSMLEEGWLSPAKSVSVKCDLDLSGVDINQNGDYNTTSLTSHVNTASINSLVVKSYLYRAGDRRSTLAFCVDLSHVAALTEAFRVAGIDARSISSLSQPAVRKETIAAFSGGEFPVLVNCEVLTEGADIPEIDCIILARPTRSRNLLAQMVGRGLRLSPDTGKTDCLLIDIVDNVDRANGLMVSPTLFGLSYEELEDSRKSSATEGVVAGGAADDDEVTDVAVKKVTFIDQENPFGLARKGRKPLRLLSDNAWVACARDRFVLELLGNGSLVIDLEPGGTFSITHRRKLPSELAAQKIFAKPRQIAQAEDLERAIQTADRYAERILGRSLVSKISRYAAWRLKPPSQKALDLFLKAKGIELVDGDKGEEVVVRGERTPLWKVTAGQVASYLCAANHGAVSQRRKQESAKAQAERRLGRQAKRLEAAAARNLPLPPT